MSGERWRDRVRSSWRAMWEAHEAFDRIADDANEQQAKDATGNFWRALFNRPPVPPEVRDARIVFERDRDDWMESGDLDDPIRQARNEELMAAATDAECAAGIHRFCRHRGEREQAEQEQRERDLRRDLTAIQNLKRGQRNDDGETVGDREAADRATPWGVIQPDGSVVGKGFVGDADAQDDMAVHPPGSIATYGADGWVNAATGHPASEGPARQVRDTSAQSVPETPMPAPTRIPGPGYVPVSTSDPERARIQQAQNHAVNLDRTAVTDQERQAAARAREEADALRDAYVGRLEAGVDAAFAERDRLDDIARASGRDEDEAAMLRQDEHAAELLDRYNAEVQTDMAEIERRRAENLIRYREHLDNGTPLPEPVEPMYQPLSPPSEDDMDGDASGNRLDPPPAAEPYKPARSGGHERIRTKWGVYQVRWLGPGRTDTNELRSPKAATTSTPSPGGTGMATIEEARAAIMDGHRVLGEVLAALEQQHSSLEEVQNGLRHATEGSNQSEADQANAQLAEAMSKIDEAKQQAAQALGEFEGVAQRL